MGYAVKVTRSRRAFTDVARFLGLPVEDTPSSAITHADWSAVVARHADLIEKADTGVVWTGYPDQAAYPHLSELPLQFDKGEIVAKTPPPELVDKMVVVARELDAYVVGEEGEPYQLTAAQQATRCCRPWGIEETLVTPELLTLSECVTAVPHWDEGELATLRESAARLSGPEARALTALILARVMTKGEDYFLFEDGVELPTTLAGLDASTEPMLVAATQAPALGIAALAKEALRERKRGRIVEYSR